MNTTARRRVEANILQEIDLVTPAAEPLYGADLLGRAIGHEMDADQQRTATPTMFFSNLVHEIIGNPTHRVMAFTAAREVAFFSWAGRV